LVRYRRDLGVLSYIQAMDAITEMTNVTAEIGVVVDLNHEIFVNTSFTHSLVRENILDDNG
jgi:hypothetical protein